MKVVIATLNYAPELTGIAPYSAGLASGLVARGHNVGVLTTFPHYPQWRHGDTAGWVQQENIDGVSVTRLRHYVPTNPQGVRRVLSELSYGARAVSRRLGRPDVVVAVSPALFAAAMVVRRALLARGPAPATGIVVQDLYGLGLRQVQGSSNRVADAVGRLEASTFQAADGVSVIHERFRDLVHERLGVALDKIVVNRNWAHVEAPPSIDSEAERARRGWNVREVIVLHTGAMGEKQGLGNVVAAARLAESRGQPVRFVMVGDGSQRAQLEASAAGVGSIEFHDSLPGNDYTRALACADVLLVNEKPGVVEMAVPSKLTSYFGSGRPVLAAADGGGTTAHEIASSGAGVRIDPGDPRALVDAALELGADKEKASRLGARGPIYAAQVLNRDRILDGYEEWLEALIRSRV